MLSSNTKIALPYNQYLDRCIKAFTTAGYMLNKRFAVTLLNNIREGVEQLIRQDIQHMFAIDVYWMKLQGVSNWFIFRPKMGQQSAGYSDIEKRYVDYKC
jgi:hypothetical protein